MKLAPPWLTPLRQPSLFQGIGRRFALLILLFSSFVTLIITSIQLFIDYQRDIQSLQTHMHQISLLYKDTLATAIWVHNRAGLHLQLEGILRLPDILYVQISDDQGAHLDSLGTYRDKRVVKTSFDLAHLHRGQNIPMGRAMVLADLDAVYDRLLSKALIILISQGIKTFIVSLFILLIFHLLIGRHLHTLSAAVRQISIGSFKPRLSMGKGDELDDLSQAFNSMASQLEKDNSEICAEIAERKSTEAALRASETRFRQLFDLVPIPLCTINQEGALRDVNARFVQLFGYTCKEVPTLTEWWHLACPDPTYRQWALEAWDKAVVIAQNEQQDISAMECQVTCKNGGTRTMLISGITIDGQILATFFDITERKQAAMALLENNINLERRVDERTAALQVAINGLESFSYSVSHDLRAPLRAISGFSQALMEDYGDKLEGEGREYLEILQQSSQKMGDLIDGLLRLSRVDRSEMNRERVDLSILAEQTIADLRQTEPDRQVMVAIAPHMVVDGDRHLLGAVVANLLSNAWKYTGKTSQPQIAFFVETEKGKNFYRVQDNGAGFDMTYADRLFQPFQRIHKTTEFPGDGIGLATVQRIIQRHGGKIWADAAVGKGATFSFTLHDVGKSSPHLPVT